MKWVPDIMTMSRALIALAIACLGFVGPDALTAVLVLTMVGWTTDIFDGRLARRFGKGTTWVGEHEFTFDMVMTFSGLCYLVMAGFIPFTPAAIYVAVAAVFIIAFRSKMITMTFATPIVALPLIVAWFKAPIAARWYIVWIVAALLLDWRRFKGVVSEFLENAKKLANKADR